MLEAILFIKEENVGLIVIDEDFIIFAEYRENETIYKGKLALLKMMEEDNAIIYPFKIERNIIHPNTLIELQEAYTLPITKL